MSISPDTDPVEAPPEDDINVDDNVEREPSPQIPSEPPDPPSSLRLHSLPRSSRRALHPPATSSSPATMPLEPSDSNLPSVADGGKTEEKVDGEESGKAKGKEKEKEAEKWVENVDYAYEYVPVVQRRQGRKNM